MTQRSYAPRIGTFSLPDFIAAKLSITRQDGSDPDETGRELVIWRHGDKFESGHGPIPTELIAALGQVPAGTQASLGMQSCHDNNNENPGAQSAYLSVEISILLKGRPPLRLRSGSQCRHMLPWNLTDGHSLAAVIQPEAGQTLITLLKAVCAECNEPSAPLPLPLDHVFIKSDFSDLFAALQSEWRRLGKGHAATWVQLHTIYLVQALQWMDQARFEHLLEKIARNDSGAVKKPARNTLQALRTAHWGYIGKTGKFILPRRYDRAGLFAAGAALVLREDVWEYIDRHGRAAIDIHTGEPWYLAHRLNPVEAAGKWGYADPEGQVVIAAAFDAAEPFLENLAAVKVAGRWGFIDERGAWVVPPQFNAVRNFSEGMAAVECDGLWGFIDRRGRFTIAPRFTDAGDFSEGLAAAR